MQRDCNVCGRDYEARQKNSQYCGATWRSRKSRGAVPSSPTDSALVRATKAELDVAGRLDTMLGQQALALAKRMSGTETGAGIAAAVGVASPVCRRGLHGMRSTS